ncbi:RimJ/RimL family protein N-acetyltransferase [Arthrobacter pascens]|uniref:GNAT family N-acetyltransferase n=1 Tax=Arthrobacter pascens TaxID=1677 RepID=UPI0028661E3B|nr:GNAT family protein [Arthrobacter pascens]MDR6555737.1 RimJ/RimL family protein N-acetyltransferase [Arthrobacter pascens]
MTNPRAVSLRPLEKSDLSYLRDLANDPEVRENVVGWDWPLSDAGQERWFAESVGQSTTKRFIIESETGQSVGLTGFWDIDWRNRSAMTAIKLGGNSEARGRGYGVAAIQAIMEFGFMDAGFNRLHATIFASNSRSIAAYVLKSGWTEEGRLRQHVWRNGVYEDLVQIGMLRSEFIEKIRN